MNASCFQTQILTSILTKNNRDSDFFHNQEAALVCVCVCVCPTRGHGGEQLGRPVGVALGAGGEDPKQTLQTHLGQAAALFLLPPRLHRPRDVGVAPHQHPTDRQTDRRSKPGLISIFW